MVDSWSRHRMTFFVSHRMPVVVSCFFFFIVFWVLLCRTALSHSQSVNHLAIKGFALFHGSVAARLQRASRLAARSFSLMLKSSSRGAIGRVDASTSIDRSELVDDADAVLRALERRLGRGMELKRMLACMSGMLGFQLV
jgi:hypothetical protein